MKYALVHQHIESVVLPPGKLASHYYGDYRGIFIYIYFFMVKISFRECSATVTVDNQMRNCCTLRTSRVRPLWIWLLLKSLKWVNLLTIAHYIFPSQNLKNVFVPICDSLFNSWIWNQSCRVVVRERVFGSIRVSLFLCFIRASSYPLQVIT